MNVREFLSENDVTFEVIQHRPTYDAQRMAQATHTPGRDVAKTVLLRGGADAPYVVAVVPSTRNIDLDRAGHALRIERAELATEPEIKEHCPDCEIGVLPPFGSRYGMKTLVDEALTHEDQIVFESNTHEESIRMSYADFDRLEQPQVASFTVEQP